MIALQLLARAQLLAAKLVEEALHLLIRGHELTQQLLVVRASRVEVRLQRVEFVPERRLLDLGRLVGGNQAVGRRGFEPARKFLIRQLTGHGLRERPLADARVQCDQVPRAHETRQAATAPTGRGGQRSGAHEAPQLHVRHAEQVGDLTEGQEPLGLVANEGRVGHAPSLSRGPLDIQAAPLLDLTGTS